MSKALRQFIPVTDNGGQLGFWADTSLTISKGGIVGVQTDEDSFIKVGDKGVGATVGDGATVTTGSPRRLVVLNPNTQAIHSLAIQAAAMEQAVATKAEQSDLDALSSEVSAKASTAMADMGAAGLVEKAVDPGDASTGAVTLITDAATAIGLLESKINALMQAMRNAGQLG